MMTTEKLYKCYFFPQLATGVLIAILLSSGLSLSLAPSITEYVVDRMDAIAGRQ